MNVYPSSLSVGLLVYDISGRLILKHFLEMDREMIHFSNNMFIDCTQEKINALKQKCIISNRSAALVSGLQDAS